jgi:predicted amidohydrolase
VPTPDPSPSLSVALVQHAAGLDPGENREAVTRLTPDGVDLVVFPEASQRDFGDAGSDVSAYAEPTDGPFATTVAEAARDHGTTVLAGMFERSDDPSRPFNTLVLRGRATADYRKVHLYDSFGYRESDRLLPGEIVPTVVDLAGFRVGLMTCYDLRFPELARLLVAEGAELLVIPSAWVAGERKLEHWRTLLRARAIENTCFVAAAGQPAPRYTGHSLVVAPTGDVLVEGGDGEDLVTARVERSVLEETRRTNPSLRNRRL